MAQRFLNKVVIITGASSPRGIGAASAQRFADEGASVALAARNADGLNAVAKQLRDRGAKVEVFPTDVTDIDACEKLLKGAAEAFGGIDILVNNAGANTRGPLESRDPRLLANVIQVNLMAPIVLTRLVLPYLRARGGGSIVQVASIAGQLPLDNEAAYSASKFGLRAFSFAVREELRDSGIHLSVVSPGPVTTDFIYTQIDDVPEVIFAQPLSSPEDIANVIVESAMDGKRERTIPIQTGILAQVANVVPSMRRVLAPVMEKRGKAAKEAFRMKHANK